jgi:hypothetical protein
MTTENVHGWAGRPYGETTTATEMLRWAIDNHARVEDAAIASLVLELQDRIGSLETAVLAMAIPQPPSLEEQHRLKLAARAKGKS